MRLQAERPLFTSRKQSGADGSSSRRFPALRGTWIYRGPTWEYQTQIGRESTTSSTTSSEVQKRVHTSLERKRQTEFFLLMPSGGEGTLLSRRARPHFHASVAPFTHHSGSDVQREPDATRTPDADANLMQASSAAE